MIAEVSGVPWENCEVVWGNTSKGLPWSSIQAGSQTTYAHTRANYATGMDLKKKLTEVAAKTKGGIAGRLRHRTRRASSARAAAW